MTLQKHHCAEQRSRHIEDWQQSGLLKTVYAQQHYIKIFGKRRLYTRHAGYFVTVAPAALAAHIRELTVF